MTIRKRPQHTLSEVADDYSPEEIQAHFASTAALLTGVEAEWPGLVSLVTTERTGNLGRLINRLDPALRALFSALTPVQGEPMAKAASKEKLAAIFDAALGAADHGKDPDHFEVGLLIQRLDRIEAQQKILERLEALRQLFSDDVLHTGTLVAEPGLAALDIARGVAASNPEFHSLLAPALDALGDMTKAARHAQALARKAVQDKKSGAVAVDPNAKA